MNQTTQLAIASTFLLAQSVHAACPDPTADFEMATEDDDVVIYYKTTPQTVPVGEFFEMTVLVCEGDELWNGNLAVDATMPAHGHGMNYTTEVKPAKDGWYVAEGFLFQMPGQWRYDFNLKSEQASRHIYSFTDVE